jgi:hypothetical protein
MVEKVIIGIIVIPVIMIVGIMVIESIKENKTKSKGWNKD